MLAQINPEIGELVAADSHVIGVEWSNAVFVQLMEQVCVDKAISHIVHRQADGAARNIITGKADALTVRYDNGPVGKRSHIARAFVAYLHIADDDVLAAIQRDTVRYAVLNDERGIGWAFLVLLGDDGHAYVPVCLVIDPPPYPRLVMPPVAFHEFAVLPSVAPTGP